MLKGFYGRYYNNLADGFSALNPGGSNYAEYNFNDLNRNGRYDGPCGARRPAAALGGADAPVDPDFKTPYTDEISGTLEHQLGRVVGPLTYVRKIQRRLRAVLRHQPHRAGVGRSS